MTDNFAMFNYEAPIAFASLALIFIGITVLWTNYQKRSRSAWFIMAVFVGVYYMPVYLLDAFFDMGRLGWSWLPALVRDTMDGNPLARQALKSLAILILMLVALVLPVRAFFGKRPASDSR